MRHTRRVKPQLGPKIHCSVSGEQCSLRRKGGNISKIWLKATSRPTNTDLMGRLPHRHVGLDVGLHEGVEVVREAVLVRQRRDARLHRPQVVPRQLREQVVQRLDRSIARTKRERRGKAQERRGIEWGGKMKNTVYTCVPCRHTKKHDTT